MALTLGDNFSYQGAKPLDARLKYDTLANMKAVADATMYDGCIAYCAETDKTYQWLAANTVDPDTGKWREFSSGDIEEMPSGDMVDVIDPLPSISGGSANPTGTIIAFMGNYAPQGYVICDGRTLNIASYTRLADFIAYQFGSKNYFGGDGTTTFAVPDLRGEFLRGTGTNGHSGEGNGAAVGTHQAASAIPDLRVNSISNKIVQVNIKSGDTDSYGAENVDATLKERTGYITQAFTGSSTASTGMYAYKVRPTNTSVLYCIKD